MFVSKKDIEELEKNGIEYEKDIEIFLCEMRDFFNKVWEDKYFITDKITTIDELNKKYLENYPSWDGYYLLESSFSACSQLELDILSSNTKQILGFLYNIHLR